MPLVVLDKQRRSLPGSRSPVSTPRQTQLRTIVAGTEEDGEGEGAFPRVTHLFPEVEVEVDRISDDDDREGRPPARSPTRACPFSRMLT